ncbi:hypothetical protein RCL1_000108 [Eukaryota sp. TZLM3-RCL]
MDLENETLGSLIEKWSNQLHSDIKDFANVAVQVERWDSQIRSNQNILSSLESKVADCSKNQTDLINTLSGLASDQSNILSVLDELEKSVSSVSTTETSTTGKGDAARGELHSKVQSVAVELAVLTEEYKSLINRLNSIEPKIKSESRDLKTITDIVATHDLSLKKLDEESEGLRRQVSQLQTSTEAFKL